MIDVSIVIVNYNTTQLTIDCIDSIIKFSQGFSYEIIVVDNGSSDRSIEEVILKHENVKLVCNSLNKGFGSANNIGYSYAKGKFLYMLNSDTILLNNAIKYFVDFYNSNKNNLNIGALGSMLVNSDLHNAHSFGVFPNYVNTIFRYKYKKNEIFITSKYNEVDYLTGASLFIPIEIINRFGFFDEQFFMYYEETDFLYRIKSLGGFCCYLIDGPSIIHLEGKSSNKISNYKRIMVEESKFKYINKNCNNNIFTYSVFGLFYLISKLLIFFNCRYSFNDNVNYYYIIIKLLFKLKK